MSRLRLHLSWRWSPSPARAGTLAVLRLLPAVSVAKTALLALGVLVATALPLAFTVDAGLLVGSVPAAAQGGLDSSAGRATLRLLAVAGALIIGGRLLAPFLAALAATFGRQVDRHLQERVMIAAGGPSGVEHLEDPSVLDLIKNAQGIGGEGVRPGAAVTALASLLPSWFLALGSAAILTAFHWWLALAWIVLWPVVTFSFQREYIRVGQVGSGQADAMRRAGYFRDLALRPEAAKEVRSWGMVGWLGARFDAAWHRAMQPLWQARHPGRPVIWLSAAVIVAANIGSLGLLVWAATRGEIGLGALAIYTQAILGVNVYRAFDDVNTHLAYAAVSVPSLLTLERRVGMETPRLAARVLPPECPREEIRFEGVTFRYAGRPVEVIGGLDLTIPAGRSLAIVGANGAGKTTLIKLLCRLYTPTGGRIGVDGVDLGAIDVRLWQRRVAAIFQDFAHYHLPVRDNVALGAPELAGDMERLRTAARRAGALELIESLPHGWDTVLSRQFTGGVDLSGGEWQRVALARALLAVEGGACVLVLDEPTAALDVRAEADLYDRFLEITAGLTTILISHRFSTVRRADRICVLAGGRVVEQGTHDELVALGGQYAEMFTLQAARFTGEVGAADEGP